MTEQQRETRRKREEKQKKRCEREAEREKEYTCIYVYFYELCTFTNTNIGQERKEDLYYVCVSLSLSLYLFVSVSVSLFLSTIHDSRFLSFYFSFSLWHAFSLSCRVPLHLITQASSVGSVEVTKTFYYDVLYSFDFLLVLHTFFHMCIQL